MLTYNGLGLQAGCRELLLGWCRVGPADSYLLVRHSLSLDALHLLTFRIGITSN